MISDMSPSDCSSDNKAEDDTESDENVTSLCELCGASFPQADLKKHRKECFEPNPSCSNSNFGSKTNFLCYFCATFFEREGELKKHMQNCQGLSFQSPSEVGNSQEKPEQESLTPQKSGYGCVSCGESFDLESDLDSHLKTHCLLAESHLNTHFLLEETYSPPSTDSLLIVVEKLKASPIPAVVCLLCGVHFKQKTDFQAHPCQHADPETVVHFSDVKKFLVTYRKPPERDSVGEPIVYICPKCDKTYSQEPALVMHLRTHFEMDTLLQDKNFKPSNMHPDETTGLVCRRCGESFRHKTELESHIKTHFLFGAVATNRNLLRPAPYTPDKPKKIIECPRCGKNMKDRRTLKRHLKTHAALDELRAGRRP